MRSTTISLVAAVILLLPAIAENTILSPAWGPFAENLYTQAYVFRWNFSVHEYGGLRFLFELPSDKQRDPIGLQSSSWLRHFMIAICWLWRVTILVAYTVTTASFIEHWRRGSRKNLSTDVEARVLIGILLIPLMGIMIGCLAGTVAVVANVFSLWNSATDDPLTAVGMFWGASIKFMLQYTGLVLFYLVLIGLGVIRISDKRNIEHAA